MLRMIIIRTIPDDIHRESQSTELNRLTILVSDGTRKELVDCFPLSLFALIRQSKWNAMDNTISKLLTQ